MSEPPKLELTKLTPPERKRVYHFPGGDRIELVGVTHLTVRPSGNHRLATSDGRKWIVPPGWLAVELDVDDFQI